ncbi:class I SAM-dependent methyltransferase [Convivina intestini]|uniref:Site-specific DNA-methyltransferase (Adenine-specific) n=1 Tax=Convivina intestini TaxID=1505726 RepID=A0A2U1D5V2_9LACO|nr:N-6 DNA methylase [Convivina intestini]PVY83056.1 site-specific DNA-methyltransferase (adenine-specific) [Convivina intestini]CAH1856461.1 hypothetical protein R077811_01257 [Convivina intestini]SDB99009.1 site-specific DNA-methyltransferase (adenine-specific) [Leuconostocaceae bacterium R-53105]
MINSKIPAYFDSIFAVVEYYRTTYKVSLTAALVAVLEYLSDGQPKDNPLFQDTQGQNLSDKMGQIDWDSLDLTEKRNVLQLLLLKVKRADHADMNSQLTPDGIGYLLGDLAYQTAGAQSGDKILDMTVGSGNLLWTVDEVFEHHQVHLKRLGFDNDQVQLALAHVSDRLLHDDETDLYQADVLAVPEDEKIKAQLVISDLPVGYYPQTVPDKYEMRAVEGKSFAHFLLIEEAMNLVAADGWLYFLVPANILEGPEHEKLLKFLATKAQLKAFLKLPENYFLNEAAAKAILILRPKEANPKGEVLVGTYPSLKEPKAFEDFLQDIKSWVKLNRSR